MRISGELTSGDLARANGISRSTAHRWLKALYRQHGDQIVSRRGNRYFTTAAALAKVAPEVARTTGVEARLHHLETWQEEQDKRMDGQAIDAIEIRKRVSRVEKRVGL